MKNIKLWHKVGLAIAVLLALVSLMIAIYYWNKLPSVIPTHFGFNGQPDDWQNKSVLWVFMIPLLQLFIAGGFIFLYWKPQYSDMPTTLWLMTMEEHKKEHAFDLIRTMLVGTGLWVGVLLTYMTIMMNKSAINEVSGMDPWLLLVIVGGMIAWLIWWTVKVYGATKGAIKRDK